MKSKGKTIGMHALIAAALALYLLVLRLTGISCPIRAALGFPCPACGITRALSALLRLDFAASFSYHPAALPIAALLFLGIHRNTRMFRFLPKKAVDWILIAGAALVFLVYLVRLHLGMIP